jgi:hypothetical protein
MIWYEIPGWPGYRISHTADILSLKRNEPRLLQPSVRGEYLRVNLTKDGQLTMVRVHVLMARTFLGECPEGMEVCHNDGNKLNCHLSNLRYDTHSENALDEVRRGTHWQTVKTQCPQGHDYTPENTRHCRRGDGKTFRQCKICTRIAIANHRARKKAGLV